MRTAMITALLLAATAAQAQPTTAVGPSVATPRAPTGSTPPGAPGTANTADQISRDSTGQQVIGHTVTPMSPVPGNTGGPDATSK